VAAYVAAAAVLAERDARRSAAGDAHPDDDGDRADHSEAPVPQPFHGRLDDQSADGPYGRLRPVSDQPEDEGGAEDEEESMARIRVVTDSACDLSAELAAERNLTIVPLTIRFGSEEFVDGATLSTDEFWSRCAASEVLPETAAPSPGAFQEAFLAAAADGYDGVLCINLSSEVSATYQAAVAAAKSVSDQIPVRTIDSRSLTMGLGLMVLDAADMAADGADLDELADRVGALIPRTQVFGVVDTLEHLEKGGRIGGARALLGSLLSIKPVVSLVDGKVEEESKQRTRARSLRYLADKGVNSPPIRRMAVCNGAATDIDEFVDMLSGVQSEFPLVVVDLGPVVGTHTGPGTIGLCMITAD
jgi:DegV family protein with EDD domain